MHQITLNITARPPHHWRLAGGGGQFSPSPNGSVAWAVGGIISTQIIDSDSGWQMENHHLNNIFLLSLPPSPARESRCEGAETDSSMRVDSHLR